MAQDGLLNYNDVQRFFIPLDNPTNEINITGQVKNVRFYIYSIGFYSKNNFPEHQESGGGGGDTPVDPPTPSGSITVTKSISDISGTTTDGTKVSVMSLDSIITANASTSGNNGKVYSSGAEWRFYQSDNGTLTISASTGYSINKILITYTTKNTGIFTEVASNTELIVNNSTITLHVGNSGSATNGQAKVTSISVTYQVNN